MSSPLFERLCQALAPAYHVERELASGGMGMVFLGRDVALDRPVAIKILRPELATALAAERFLREARILANLSHPNIVPVHQVGEAGGFFYYVMDYVEGETLADRLTRTALSWRDAVKLGRDLLDALEAAHRLGVVHRDIKPSNVFLLGGRAVLADFGIAKPTGEADQSLTASGSVVGTPDYMPPEQALGGVATPRTDLYAVGMVLYEALTRRPWSIADRPDRADWSGVPRGVARVMRRALEWVPEDRWPDAAAFRRALWRRRVWPYRRRTIALTLAGLVTGVGIALLWRGPRSALPVGLRIDVEPFIHSGGTTEPWLAESVAHAVARGLDGYPDFTVVAPGARGPRAGKDGARVRLRGQVAVSADTVRVEASLLLPGGATPFTARGPTRQWRALADTVVDGVLPEVFELREPSLDPWLPPAVRPKTRAGQLAFLKAERLLARALWGAADSAYQQAEALDTTCLICSYRHVMVERWLARQPDPTHVRRYVDHIGSFPAAYQSLIRASEAPLSERLDTLEAASRLWRGFFPASFDLGDELYHRGPLVGRLRSGAVEPLRAVVQLRPRFAPAWEHLAMVLIADGDSAGAREALERLRGFGDTRDPYTVGLQTLLHLGFAWRFHPGADAAGATGDALRDTLILSNPNLASGPRLLLTFEAPQGAVWLGERFAGAISRPELQRSGLIAQVLGLLALGRPDSARALARRLAERFSETNLELFAAELDGALLLFDFGAEDLERRAVEHALEEHAAPGPGSAQERRRAAWMLALLASKGEDSLVARRYEALVTGEAPPRPLSRLLAATAAASRGDWARALAMTDTLRQLHPSQVGDPFYRVVLHLSRDGWYRRRGRVDGARAELRWHENEDAVGLPEGDPQPMDLDMAFGTLARWRRAELLHRADRQGKELCAAYGAVKRLWAQGEPRYRARADSAGVQLAVLRCGARP